MKLIKSAEHSRTRRVVTGIGLVMGGLLTGRVVLPAVFGNSDPSQAPVATYPGDAVRPAGSSVPKLSFKQTPSAYFTYENCVNDPYASARILQTPKDTAKDFGTQTIGMEQSLSNNDMPTLSSGATIRAFGGDIYQVATSDERPDQSIMIDLKKSPFAVVLDGGLGYDTLFSARVLNNGTVDFVLSCLPNLSNGDIPQPPPEIVNPSTDLASNSI